VGLEPASQVTPIKVRPPPRAVRRGPAAASLRRAAWRLRAARSGLVAASPAAASLRSHSRQQTTFLFVMIVLCQ
jgi:hypothetical protein